MDTIFKMLGVDNCGAKEETLVDLNTDSMISTEISDAPVEMTSLIDTPRVKSSLSYANVIGDDSLSMNELMVVENGLNDVVTKPAYNCTDLNHIDAGLVTILNFLRSANACCRVTFDPGGNWEFNCQDGSAPVSFNVEGSLYVQCSFIKGSRQSFGVFDPDGNYDIQLKLSIVEPDEYGKKSLLSMNP
ncbi:OLC1v1025001C1 [Oldenlandia corymbosa var. corymbosa]|uniref:OLC1v1025001C1 n=1 Tax=Oldenlandia corymbosa var. corymbosa TaxID=529605 RepID=A0AAV1C6I2_OLDCO|nr:OLC1v1025001C1 [Oldenlandia corymbosa var. corymbosa]